MEIESVTCTFNLWMFGKALDVWKSISGCLEKLNRFGMNRFSKDIEFLVHWAVVLKTSVHKS